MTVNKETSRRQILLTGAALAAGGAIGGPLWSTATAGSAAPMGGALSPPPGFRNLAFFDDFEEFSHCTGPSSGGRWRTSYHWGDQRFSPEHPTEFGSGRGGINSERQWYTDDDTFAIVREDSRSCLRITARKRRWTSFGREWEYTSGLINSDPAYSAAPPVYVECAFKQPRGIGLFPAWWSYNKYDSRDEIDFHEGSGRTVWPADEVPATRFHSHGVLPEKGEVGGGYFKTGMKTYDARTGKVVNTPLPGLTVPDFTEEFVAVGCAWTADEMKFFINRQHVETLSRSDGYGIPRGPLHLIVNLACNGPAGIGQLVGDISQVSTAGPWHLHVDYVAAWKP
jgi:hypothetical protein